MKFISLNNKLIVKQGLRGGEGGSGLKISKTWFQDNGWSKSSTQWANFLVGFGGPRPLGVHVVAHFPAKSGPKYQNEQ